MHEQSSVMLSHGGPSDAAPVGQKAIVHVVDDNPSMREALQDLFLSMGLETRTYATARDFLATAVSDAPGCLLIDIRLPDMNGLDFQLQLTQTGVRLPVVMMTGYGDIPMSVRAMKHGAVDFLPKPFKDQDMLDAVLAAIERDRQRRAVDGDVSKMRERFGTLSAREQQVMLLVTTGKMNKQVAGRPRNQRDHRENSSRCGDAQNGRRDPGGPYPDGGRDQPQAAAVAPA
jgi:FixJ family two-component response regulator